ncbi:MAG: hypothetical protein ABW179_12525, partial [Methylobacterium sp.]
LAVEYGDVLTIQTEHQRVSDEAAFAGALAFGQGQSEDAMRASAYGIGQLHGIAATQMTVALVASPRSAGTKAVSVSIASPHALFLAKVLGAKDLTIASDSMAEVGGGTDGAGCIIALDPAGTGITMSGGTTLNAPKCTVASNASITSPCGTKIVTKNATYNWPSAPDQPSWCKSIQKPDGTPAPMAKQATPDPLADNKAVATAVDRLKLVAKLQAPNAPGGGGGKGLDFNPWDMGKRQTLTQALAEQGCSAVYGSIWTVSCDPARKSFKFGDFLVDAGQMVEFDLGRDRARHDIATYTFASIKSQGGGNYRFGAGNYVVPGGITMGGSEATFGAGSFQIGQGPCGFSICGGNNGAMTFAGPSDFQLPFGVVMDGGVKGVLGSGSRNSYRIGPSTTDRAIHVRSGSLVLAGAGGSATTFEVKGRIETGGGSCLALPASAQHDIAGSIDASGALELGAGIYTIDGYLGLGQNSGGAADCNGRNTSLYAKDVTVVLSGKETMTSWACQGTSFCASSGYSKMVLTSPETGDFAQIGVVGPQGNKAGATLTSGASGGIISGAFYFPKGPIKMDGGASASGTQNNCMMMIGTSITISGGTAAASECEKLKGGAGGAGTIVKLVR